MTLEAADQLGCLPTEVPERKDPRALSASSNPLLALNLALWSYFSFWWDDFCPKVTALEAFDSALKRLGEIREDGPGIFCLEEFMFGDSWRQLRELARAALTEAGVGTHPVPRPIEFDQLVELPDSPISIGH